MTYTDRITDCHVTLEAPHNHSRHGRNYRVAVDLHVPGREVVVGNVPAAATATEDLYAAIDRAFDQVGRQLADHVRRQNDVREREQPYRSARVSKLWSHEGFGFLEPIDGGEVYFHRNSVLHRAFDRLEIGAKVRFVEELGDKGPQASTVIVE